MAPSPRQPVPKSNVSGNFVAMSVIVANEAPLLARQQLSVPALADPHAWREKTLPVITPKNALGTVLSYMCNYWHADALQRAR